MRIDLRKLNNNNQLNDELKELEIYTSDNKPADDSIERYEHRKRMYKDAYYKKLGSDISIIVKPNHKFKPYLTSKNKFERMKECDDYEVYVYWKQVEVASYSGYGNTLYIDHLLSNDEWFINNILPLVKTEIPNEDFKVSYESYYVDWDNRPFIVST